MAVILRAKTRIQKITQYRDDYIIFVKDVCRRKTRKKYIKILTMVSKFYK